MIGEFSFVERENLNHAYSIAAKGIRMPTLRKLGLSEKYHQALQRYSEVSYRHGLDSRYLASPALTWIRSLLIEARIPSKPSSHSPNGWSRCGKTDPNCTLSGLSFFPSATTAPFTRALPSSRGFLRPRRVCFSFAVPTGESSKEGLFSGYDTA